MRGVNADAMFYTELECMEEIRESVNWDGTQVVVRGGEREYWRSTDCNQTNR